VDFLLIDCNSFSLTRNWRVIFPFRHDVLEALIEKLEEREQKHMSSQPVDHLERISL
jgi:hypothetical protein